MNKHDLLVVMFIMAKFTEEFVNLAKQYGIIVDNNESGNYIISLGGSWLTPSRALSVLSTLKKNLKLAKSKELIGIYARRSVFHAFVDLEQDNFSIVKNLYKFTKAKKFLDLKQFQNQVSDLLRVLTKSINSQKKAAKSSSKK